MTRQSNTLKLQRIKEELEAKLDPQTVKKLKAYSSYISSLGSAEEEYFYLVYENLVSAKEGLHPLIYSTELSEVSVTKDGEVLHPLNYFYQQEAMTKVWSARQGLVTGGGSSSSSSKPEAKAVEKEEAKPVVEEVNSH